MNISIGEPARLIWTRITRAALKQISGSTTTVVFAVISASIAAIPALLSPAYAQDSAPWPSRAVRLVVPSSPGGGTDTFARLLALGLAERLKQQFVVDNRPGASGNIGAEIAAKAPPDGYTLLVSASPALLINPSLYKNLPYHAERDFAPITRGVTSPAVFTSHPSMPVKTFAALVALSKRAPGKLSYGTAGAGSPGTLLVKMIEEASKVRFIQVPYKGIGQAVQGLLRGEIDFMVSDTGSVLPHVRSGKVVALAVTTKTPNFPAVPTLAEAGYPGIETYVSFMVVAPAGVPPAIVQRLNTEIAGIMKTAKFRERLDGLGYVPVFDTPDEFALSLKKERQMWADVIRRNNITLE